MSNIRPFSQAVKDSQHSSNDIRLFSQAVKDSQHSSNNSQFFSKAFSQTVDDSPLSSNKCLPEQRAIIPAERNSLDS